MVKKLCQSIGLASLLLVMNYGAFLGGGADVRMHAPFALGGVALAQIADIFLLGIAIFAVLALLRRTSFYIWGRLLLLLAVPPFLLERTLNLYPASLRPGLVPAFTALWVSVLLLLVLNYPQRYRQLLRAGDALAIASAAFAALSILQLLWVAAWKHGPYQHLAAWNTSPQPPRQHPLLVWIVFDELSYHQVFEQRAHDLALPHFDDLRRQSTLFTDVELAGTKTVLIIPALLGGKSVDGIRYSFRNRLDVHTPGPSAWHGLNGSQTVFGDARSLGWRTAVVGWYNPYCAIYGDAIDSCYWMNLDRIDGLMSQRSSFWRNTATPLTQMLGELRAPLRARQDACAYDVRQRYQTHLDLQAHAVRLLEADQADFVFLHLSLPHSPSIWSRLDDRFTTGCGSSYLDNLALADLVLGRYLQILEASPRWKDTTLIVQGDHGWRIPVWNSQAAWTGEDEEASRDRSEPRPALLIHRAGQTEPAINASHWPLLRIHDVIEGVLRGQQAPF